MTAHDDLGLRLRRHLLATADGRPAEGALEAVLSRTSSARPWPLWLVLLRGSTLRGPGMPAIAPRVRWVVLAGALVALAIALVLAGRRSGPVPGLLAYSRDGAIHLARPDGTGTVLAADADVQFRVRAWSPSGGLLAVQSSEPAVFVLDPATTAIRRVGAGQFVGWASDESLLIEARPTGVREVTRTGEIIRELGRWTLPALSPDAEWLAGERGGDLVVISVATGGTTRVADAPPLLARSTDWDGATWSPDSAWLAHSVGGPGLAVVRRDGTDPRLLDVPFRSVGRQSWSPTGEWIAYLANDRVPFGDARPYVLGISRPDGSEHRVLVDEVGEARADEFTGSWDRYRWTPDGRRIVFFAPGGRLAQVEIATSVVSPFGPLEAGVESIAWQSLAHPARDPVPSHAPPVASDVPEVPLGTPVAGPRADPERAWAGLVYSRLISDGGPDDGRCAAVILDFATGGITSTTMGAPGDLGTPSRCGLWSPDGSLQVVSQSSNAVVVLGRDGMEMTRVEGRRHGLVRIASVEWSPGGTMLLVRGCQADATPPTIPLDLPGLLDPSCAPAWLIARVDDASVTELPGEPRWAPQDAAIAVQVPDGTLLVGPGDASELHAVGGMPLPDAWAPDGGRFVVLQDGDVWIADAGGGGRRNLTQFAVPGATAAAWAPDGSWIAVIQGDAVWLVAPDRAARQPVRLAPTRPSGLEWSPDGRYLAIVAARGDASERVALIDVARGSGTVIDGVGIVGWSPDSSFLLVGSTEAGTLEVVRADGSGRRTLLRDQWDLSTPRWLGR